jgi:hypothetical protein
VLSFFNLNGHKIKVNLYEKAFTVGRLLTSFIKGHTGRLYFKALREVCDHKFEINMCSW